MAAPFRAGPYDTDPACAPGGGPAITAVPQHGHCRPGSAHSVTVLVTGACTTCAHAGAPGAAPSSPAPQRPHPSILRLDPGTQPGPQLTLPHDHISQPSLLSHSPQACSTRPKGSNTRQRRRVAPGTTP